MARIAHAARRRPISRKAALRRLSAMAVKRSILSISSIFSRSALAMKVSHAHASVGEKLMDQRHGVSFTPHVLLHELFRLVGPPLHCARSAIISRTRAATGSASMIFSVAARRLLE